MMLPMMDVTTSNVTSATIKPPPRLFLMAGPPFARAHDGSPPLPQSPPSAATRAAATSFPPASRQSAPADHRQPFPLKNAPPYVAAARRYLDERLCHRVALPARSAALRINIEWIVRPQTLRYRRYRWRPSS